MDKLIGREKEIKQLNDYVTSDRFSMPYSFCTLRYFGSYYLACPALSFLYIPLQVVV